MLLRLTDGTTTLTLSGAGAYLGATYTPSRGDGQQVSETFPIVLEGDAATIRAATNAVERMLSDAESRSATLSPKVWLEYRPVDSGDIFRSLVTSGYLKWPTSPTRRQLIGSLNTVEVNVVLQRRDEWEGPEEEVYASSSTQTERLGGVTINNNDNAGTPNWVGFASSRVKGTRPSPVRLKITNATGGTVTWRRVYIGLNVFSDPANADVWLLGSEATSPGAAATWSAGIDHGSRIWTIPFTTTLLGQTQGRMFRVLAAFTALSNPGNMRASVGSWIGSVYGAQQTGGERQPDSQLVDLGLFSIPPGGFAVANSGAALVISVRNPTLGGSGTLDFVQLMPTDSYRELTQIGYNAANGDSIVDDGIDGGSYLLVGSARQPIISAAGEPLALYPGRTQRMHVLFEQNPLFTPTSQTTIQVYCRPIYDTI